MIRTQVEDQPLAALTADRIESLLALFASRPTSKTTARPMAYTTCRNVLITARQFLNWLDRSEQFRWSFPPKFRFSKTRIKRLPQDRVKTRTRFTIDELKIIWKYAMAWDRALITLALNCGFSKAELATLQDGEIQQGKSHAFVKRVRAKTNAYGEWVLWPESLDALEYLKKLHRGGTPYVVVSKTGKPLDKGTRGGNENQVIKNHWDRLMSRILKDYPDFHRLPFKCLRKTGAGLVRHLAPNRATELASMFLAHGEASDSADQLLPVYTERPWKKLHRTILRMRRHLLPVFQSVQQPWEERHHSVSPLTREKIRTLRSEGRTYEDIGKEVGLHHVTVGKICRKL